MIIHESIFSTLPFPEQKHKLLLGLRQIVYRTLVQFLGEIIIIGHILGTLLKYLVKRPNYKLLRTSS